MCLVPVLVDTGQHDFGYPARKLGELGHNAMVPSYRTFGWVGGDQRVALAPLYRLPQPTVYTHAGTAPVLGAALGVLAARRPKVTTALSAVAMAEGGLQLSVLQMRRNLAELSDCAQVDSSPNAELMLRARRDKVMAFERAMKAIELFVSQSGPDDDSDGRVERVWRDVQTSHMHVANDVAGSYRRSASSHSGSKSTTSSCDNLFRPRRRKKGCAAPGTACCRCLPQ
jgi:hypothetical protein